MDDQSSPKPFHFIATIHPSIPVPYFNSDWTRHILGRNIIRHPLSGLNNFGFSCFMNSVLQCLSYSPGLSFFAEHLPNIIYETNLSRPCFLHHFGELCQSMRTYPSVSPHFFFTNLSLLCPDMKSGEQQDAHEFLFSLLNMFDQECECAFGKFDTAVRALFGGKLGEIRECQRCGTNLETESRFLDMKLTVENETIEECFQQLLGEQKSSEAFCRKCRRKRNFLNRYSVREAPEILIVTLMRFTSNGDKIEKAVNFGFELDLSQFVAQGVHELFELFAVLLHNGEEANKGHFLSYVKCADGVWYSADDSKVVKIGPKVVLLSRPYILFYKRKVIGLPIEPVMVTFGLSDEEEEQVEEEEERERE
jgi:ubiquitin carboxyl-terminal hydrolase 36/42